MKDILYIHDDYIFSYRVGGVPIRNGKVLLQRPRGDDYAIIGGHVTVMEESAETLKREFSEELHAKIEIGGLIAMGEIFFEWKDRPCHQVCLYYAVEFKSDVPEGTFYGFDELGDERIDLEFSWIPIEELRRGLKVYPMELIPYIIAAADAESLPPPVHFTSK